MKNREIKKVFKGNEEFLAGMQEDFVQQRIFGEIWLLRGLFKLLERSKSVAVFILSSLLVQGLFFVSIIGIIIVAGAIIDIFKQGNHVALVLLFSPFVIFIGIAFLLAVKITRKLFSVLPRYSKNQRIISWFVFVFFTILNIIVLFQTFLIFMKA